MEKEDSFCCFQTSCPGGIQSHRFLALQIPRPTGPSPPRPQVHRSPAQPGLSLTGPQPNRASASQVPSPTAPQPYRSPAQPGPSPTGPPLHKPLSIPQSPGRTGPCPTGPSPLVCHPTGSPTHRSKNHMR